MVAATELSIAAEAVEQRAPAVLQVLPSLVAGGVERGAVDVAVALAASGWTALVASAGGPMVRELERAGAVHVTLPLDSKSPRVMYANVRRLAELIEARGVDIVHARSRAPAWSALYAARRTHRPFVTTFHGSYGDGNPLKHAYNAVMAKGARVIAVSEYIARVVTGRYHADPARVRVIPRGIDFSVFDPAAVSAERMIKLASDWRLADGVPVIMLPGRLTRRKGQDVLVEAVSRLHEGELRCLLVGNDRGRPGYRREIENGIRRRGVADIVHIVDHCNDMPAAYMLADVVVSASTEPEAFGRVAVEAQAMGRPVIAADHGAARETVLADETGLLVPPGDAQALAEALREALRLGAAEREALAARAIAHVHAHFDCESMCTRTLEVYAELLDEPGGR